MKRHHLRNEISLCYLCGLPLSGKIDNDHVPMRQLYGKEYRKISNPNLFCLPTHQTCNREYQPDEDYFVYSLVPFAMHRQPGSYVALDITNRSRKGKQRPLLLRIMAQFELGIPDTEESIRRIPLDGDRINRILWKITRGLYFKETGIHIDCSAEHVIEYYSEDDCVPEEIVDALKNIPGKGDYPTVFNFRYVVADHAHCFIMTLWNSITILTAFHLLDCQCEQCRIVTT